MKEQKEFKKGDKCCIELEVVVTDNGGRYPLIAKGYGNITHSFTKEGLYRIDDTNPTLKHIEDITPKPEFPKWMMVSNTGNKNDYHLRKVMLFYNNRFYAVRNAEHEEMAQEETKSNLKEWALAKEPILETEEVSDVHKTIDDMRFDKIEAMLKFLNNRIDALSIEHKLK